MLLLRGKTGEVDGLDPAPDDELEEAARTAPEDSEVLLLRIDPPGELIRNCGSFQDDKRLGDVAVLVVA